MTMRPSASRSAITAFAFVIALSAAGAQAITAKNPKIVSIEKATNTWLEAVASHQPEKVAALYEKDAVLLPTLRNGVWNTPEMRLNYFKKFTALPEIHGVINEAHPRLLDENTAINDGIYTFIYKMDGKETKVPARFSFTYLKQNGEWKIVEHHSSKLPEPLPEGAEVTALEIH